MDSDINLMGESMDTFSNEFDNKIIEKLKSSVHDKRLVQTRVDHVCWFCNRILKARHIVARFTVVLDAYRGYQATVYACYGTKNEQACNFVAAIRDEETPDLDGNYDSFF